MFHLQVGKPKLSYRGKSLSFSEAGLQNLGFQASPESCSSLVLLAQGSQRNTTYCSWSNKRLLEMESSYLHLAWFQLHKFPGLPTVKTRWLFFITRFRHSPLTQIFAILIRFPVVQQRSHQKSRVFIKPWGATTAFWFWMTFQWGQMKSKTSKYWRSCGVWHAKARSLLSW